MDNQISIYIHIPFCIQKCYYCDFCSIDNMQDNIGEYIEALMHEMDIWSSKLNSYKISSIFIGGGTPSVIPVYMMEKLLNKLHSVFDILPYCEFSIETNPGTLDSRKLNIYMNYGINRLSIGLQAWQNRLLRQLGRIHDQQQFVDNYKLARKIGFDNINIDLMFGLPDQSLSDWKETLAQIIMLKPEHISAYGLNIGADTQFGKWYNKGLLNLPSEEEERNMYHFTINYLTQRGYMHYEISNFSQGYKECLHNLNYWENGNYIGLGLAAHSHMKSMRFSNTEKFEQYIMKINHNKLPIEYCQRNTTQDEIFETIFLGLRLLKGINKAKFMERFKFDPIDRYMGKLEMLTEKGLLEFDDNHIRLTRKGIDLSNRVFIEFLPG